MERSETILVVDDAEPIRRVLCSMLSQWGYQCLAAADGAEALRLMDEDPAVKLVITDMIMPGMGGVELAHRLAGARPDVRIMFMSGYTGDPVVQALEHSPAYFLSKPFATATLKDKVREVLASPWKGLPGEGPWAACRSGST